MKYAILSAMILILPFTTFATTSTATTKSESLKLINSAELEKLMTESKATTFVFDANNEKTRTKDGIIPGAQLLTSSSKYDASVLPADKNSTLVFYCANQKCMASHDAAKVAIEKGYKNAIVMADGIQGWKKAGKPVEKFAKN